MAQHSALNDNLWSEPLCKLLVQLGEYKSTVPEAVIENYLRSAGVSPEDPKLVKLISLVADKFLYDVVHDAKKLADRKNKAELVDEFRLEDLEKSLDQKGVYLHRIGTATEVNYTK